MHGQARLIDFETVSAEPTRSFRFRALPHREGVIYNLAGWAGGSSSVVERDLANSLLFNTFNNLKG